MNKPILDAAGNEIEVGDRVAYISQGGDTQSLSIGFVVEFTPKKVRIRREKESKYYDPTCLKYPVQIVVSNL
jgi:hypothetical protein